MADEPTRDDAPRPGEAPPGSEPLGLDAARFHLRDVGFCVPCDHFVERSANGECPRGHAARLVAGRMLLEDSDEMPKLPRFNLAAFLIPPIWGLFYGQWAGVFFVPAWIFAANALESAQRVGGPWVIGGWAIAAATLAFQFFFAWRANGTAWRTVCHRQTIAEFHRRQLIWAAASIAVWATAIAWVAVGLTRG